MSKLKVVQLLPELNIGGVERGTKDFSEALVQRGHKSIVISNGGLFEKDIINAGGIHLKLPIHKKNPFLCYRQKSWLKSIKSISLILFMLDLECLHGLTIMLLRN